jgi:hypothetical protein
MEQIALLSLVTATLSFSLCETKLFAPWREWANKHAAILGEILACGYCCGHWIAFCLEAVYRPRLFVAWWPLDYFLSAIVIAGLAGFQWALLCLVTAMAEK